jgi:hypothetical protein
MNEGQKKVVMISAVIIVLMLIFPPFHYINQIGVEINMGFSFLFNPPSRSSYVTGSINMAQLFLQWVGVGFVGGLIYFLQKDKE